jgi:hypothetical protein
VDDPSLRGIVRSLQLRYVDDMAAHTCCGYKAAILEIDLVAIDVGALLGLSPPVETRGTRAIERTIQVCIHHVMVVFDLAVEHRALRPRDAGIGNKNIEAAIEFLDNFVYHRVDMLLVSDVDLIGLACRRLHNSMGVI